MGSDGESDQASGTSSDEVQSPTGVCLRTRTHRRISMEVRASSLNVFGHIWSWSYRACNFKNENLAKVTHIQNLVSRVLKLTIWGNPFRLCKSVVR